MSKRYNNSNNLDNIVSILRAIGLLCGGASTLLGIYSKTKKTNNFKNNVYNGFGNNYKGKGKYIPQEKNRKED